MTLSQIMASTIPKIRYLSAWFCPYAHRATLALEHHKGRVDYEWVEALGWEKNNEDEWYYHWKSDELKQMNPSALVPTFVLDNNRSIYESLVCMDYVDAVSQATGKSRLVPSDPYWAAQCRIWADKVDRECCSPYYGVLVRKEDSERREHFQSLLAGLRRFSKQLEQTDGPVFLPGGQLSVVDLTLIPWAFRFYVLEHYRGPEFIIPSEPELEHYHKWFDYVMNLESVKRTLPDKDRYLEHICKYADGSARSKVANAVRRGVAAHQLDDDKD